VEFDYIVILITVGSHDEAEKIARELIDRKKAACVNIVPQVRSIFRWQEAIEEEEERLLVVKTRAQLFSEVVTVVRGIHSYEVPEIIALPIIDGNREYLMWINKETEGI